MGGRCVASALSLALNGRAPTCRAQACQKACVLAAFVAAARAVGGVFAAACWHARRLDRPGPRGRRLCRGARRRVPHRRAVSRLPARLPELSLQQRAHLGGARSRRARLARPCRRAESRSCFGGARAARSRSSVPVSPTSNLRRLAPVYPLADDAFASRRARWFGVWVPSSLLGHGDVSCPFNVVSPRARC